MADHGGRARPLEIFWAFLRLGFTSFGGPVAHLGYFHDEFVKRRRWLEDSAYADLVALCQFLPGPASSEVGIGIGLARGGVAGSLAAWLGFTLPSAVVLAAFGLGVTHFPNYATGAWLHGFKLAAVPIVAQALWVMGRKLCTTAGRVALATLATAASLLFPSPWGQVAIIAAAALAGRLFLRAPGSVSHAPLEARLSRRAALTVLIVFFSLLIVLPWLAGASQIPALRMFDSFFRAGSLVFGGGHVVLPLLKAEMVNPGWVSADHFVAGYGAAQAVPGPLFTFAAYLGAVSTIPPTGWAGAALCLVAAFLPSFFLVFGALPFWDHFRRFEGMRAAMQGIHAAVVGLLLAAFYNPIWVAAIHAPRDAIIALAGFLLLMLWRIPSWAVVLLTILAGGMTFWPG